MGVLTVMNIQPTTNSRDIFTQHCKFCCSQENSLSFSTHEQYAQLMLASSNLCSLSRDLEQRIHFVPLHLHSAEVGRGGFMHFVHLLPLCT